MAPPSPNKGGCHLSSCRDDINEGKRGSGATNYCNSSLSLAYRGNSALTSLEFLYYKQFISQKSGVGFSCGLALAPVGLPRGRATTHQTSSKRCSLRRLGWIVASTASTPSMHNGKPSLQPGNGGVAPCAPASLTSSVCRGGVNKA